MNDELTNTEMPETTGRFIMTFREGAHSEAMAQLKKQSGLTKAKMMNSADFGLSGIDISQFPDSGGVLLDHIGVAVVSIDAASADAMALDAGEDSAILAVEPAGILYALGEACPLPLDYLRGVRRAAESV